jgi:hypothetical protein
LARQSTDNFGTELTKVFFMESPQEKKFIPKGAMAFFVLLVLLALLFWYGIYLLMIDRV